MNCILDLDKTQLQNYLTTLGQPSFRWKQIWHGLYVSHFDSWQQFTNIPIELRNKLREIFLISPLQPRDTLVSQDNSTEKILFTTNTSFPIETVLMRYEDRISICVSTQSGCPIGCKFCATGKLGLKKNLTSGEIITQILHFVRMLDEEQQRITNIVVMGMGEPFLNYSEVSRAIRVLTDVEGLNIGSRRITVSSIGIPEYILQFAQDFPQVNLAISLHAANDEKRNAIVPVNNKYNIASILDALIEYRSISNRRVTIEYVLIRDFNDSSADAHQLGNLLHGLLCHVNLIPLNSTAYFDGSPSPLNRIEAFQKILDSYHIPTTIRYSKGTQIQAGCGQLAGGIS